MDIGVIGLGRMGGNMAARLARGGHRVVGFDFNPEAGDELQKEGGEFAPSLEELVGALEAPRAVWIMVPVGAPVDSTLDNLLPLLEPGDVICEGGNSFYKDSLRRAARAAEHGVEFVDVGTSGGVWGLKEGYSMMVGGSDEALAHVTPLLETLAPDMDMGWGHVGAVGSGHFVKMVHNGIEYGLMQAYAEGFSIMKAKEEFDLDLYQISEIWRHGSVVRSWLLDLTALALKEDQSLKTIAPYVSDSGHGRSTVKEAIDLDVPAPVITQALLSRIESRFDDGYTYRLLSALRNQFGGHEMKEATMPKPGEAE